MPHQNTTSSKATAQNAATDPGAPPSDQAREAQRSIRPEARRYAAPDVADATLAPPAAGEVAEYMDEGDALGIPGVQMGRNHTRRPDLTEARRQQGPKTRAAIRRTVSGKRAG
ncbi:MAG TPA: hypothetical protein VKT30_11735 [Caulobacteraceae bacterium]|nr:hypothetical protein [Caulobacteraceae bacterium]